MKSLNRADQQNHCQGLYDKLITILKTNKMNLKNLNVAELNAQELKETEGGWWFVPLLGYIIVETLTNPRSSSNSLANGYNDHK